MRLGVPRNPGAEFRETLKRNFKGSFSPSRVFHSSFQARVSGNAAAELQEISGLRETPPEILGPLPFPPRLRILGNPQTLFKGLQRAFESFLGIREFLEIRQDFGKSSNFRKLHQDFGKSPPASEFWETPKRNLEGLKKPVGVPQNSGISGNPPEFKEILEFRETPPEFQEIPPRLRMLGNSQTPF